MRKPVNVQLTNEARKDLDKLIRKYNRYILTKVYEYTSSEITRQEVYSETLTRLAVYFSKGRDFSSRTQSEIFKYIELLVRSSYEYVYRLNYSSVPVNFTDSYDDEVTGTPVPKSNLNPEAIMIEKERLIERDQIILDYLSKQNGTGGEYIYEYFINGRTCEDIAEQFGTTRQNVHGFLTKKFGKLTKYRDKKPDKHTYFVVGSDGSVYESVMELSVAIKRSYSNLYNQLKTGGFDYNGVQYSFQKK